MKAPSKAVILAAGYGTRMAPLTERTPKPAMPLWGKPLLHHTLRLLSDWGVREVLINVHHLPQEILKTVRQYADTEICINFSFEPRILGTGGALTRASWFLADTECFWLLNGDIAVDAPPAPFLRRFTSGKCMAAVGLFDRSGPRTVETKDSAVRTFRSPNPGAEGTSTFCGVQLVSREILRFAKPNGFQTIIEMYENAMRRRYEIGNVSLSDYFWADLGTPEGYVKAHEDILHAHAEEKAGARFFDPARISGTRRLKRTGVKIPSFAALGKNVTVSPGAHVSRAVLWDSVRVDPSARIRDAVVDAGPPATRCIEGLSTSALNATDSWILDAVRHMRWPREKCRIDLLGERGSDRRFVRVHYGMRSVLAIHYGTAREENSQYASHAAFLLRHGVSVPEVVMHSQRKRLLLMYDAGGLSLSDWVQGKHDRAVLNMYEKVMKGAHRMHQLLDDMPARQKATLARAFDKELYRWEHDYFIEQFLVPYVNPPAKTLDALRRDLMEVAAMPLLSEHPVLVHRDLQSSNILIEHGRLVFIDFQGMRSGPAVYDIASLLCDPYVNLPLRSQNSLLRKYAHTSHRPLEQITRVFWAAALQRLAQAVGAYGKLSRTPGTKRFQNFILPGLHMMDRAIQYVRADSILAHAVASAIRTMNNASGV